MTETAEKKMTIEKLAIITQQQFSIVQTEIRGLRTEMAVMRSEMATKVELAGLRDEMRQEFINVRDEMKAGFRDVIDQVGTVIREEIRKVAYAPEIDALRHRVTRIEKKVGIKHRP